ncbi:Hypothetical predicted protein, partial [Podarcis lilfordi]
MAVEGREGSLGGSPARGKKSGAQKSAGAEGGWELEQAAAGSPPPPSPRGTKGGGGGGGRLALLRKTPEKNAEILSSQYGLHLFLAGLLLMFAWAVHAKGFSQSAVLSYLITLMLLQILWMAWYICRRYAHQRLIQDKDTHAGARWLK